MILTRELAYVLSHLGFKYEARLTLVEIVFYYQDMYVLMHEFFSCGHNQLILCWDAVNFTWYDVSRISQIIMQIKAIFHLFLSYLNTHNISNNFVR